MPLCVKRLPNQLNCIELKELNNKVVNGWRCYLNVTPLVNYLKYYMLLCYYWRFVKSAQSKSVSKQWWLFDFKGNNAIKCASVVSNSLDSARPLCWLMQSFLRRHYLCQIPIIIFPHFSKSRVRSRKLLNKLAVCPS